MHVVGPPHHRRRRRRRRSAWLGAGVPSGGGAVGGAGAGAGEGWQRLAVWPTKGTLRYTSAQERLQWLRNGSGRKDALQACSQELARSQG